MFGRIVHRTRLVRPSTESRGIIAAGGKWLCQDWTCPAKASCGRHWGRSRAYAAMADYLGALLIPDRDRELEFCDQYVLDQPRKWLMA